MREPLDAGQNDGFLILAIEFSEWTGQGKYENCSVLQTHVEDFFRSGLLLTLAFGTGGNFPKVNGQGGKEIDWRSWR